MGDVKMEIKEKTMDTCKILDKLQSGLLAGLSKPEEMPIQEAKEITDMIKDIAEAKEKIVKSVYYEKITEAMEEAEYGEDFDEDGPIERAGYRGRNPRTGRFVSRGRGAGIGYGYTESPLIYDPIQNYRMGYKDGQENSGNMQRENGNMNGNSGHINAGNMGQSRHGMAYDEYKTRRRYYTENPTGDNKLRMQQKWEESVDDAIRALKDMYMEAEPDQRRKVNAKVAKALQEMPPA